MPTRKYAVLFFSWESFQYFVLSSDVCSCRSQICHRFCKIFGLNKNLFKTDAMNDCGFINKLSAYQQAFCLQSLRSLILLLVKGKLDSSEQGWKKLKETGQSKMANFSLMTVYRSLFVFAILVLVTSLWSWQWGTSALPGSQELKLAAYRATVYVSQWGKMKTSSFWIAVW